MPLYADIDKLRAADSSRAQITHQLAAELRAATDSAQTIDPVLAQLTWLSDEQKAEANRLIDCGDYPSLGKLLCDAHEQLVAARLLGAVPYRVRLFDEAH